MDGELSIFAVKPSGLAKVGSIVSHKRHNVSPDREPVTDFHLKLVNPSSIAVYVFEAFGTLAVYQIFLS